MCRGTFADRRSRGDGVASVEGPVVVFDARCCALGRKSVVGDRPRKKKVRSVAAPLDLQLLRLGGAHIRGILLRIRSSALFQVLSSTIGTMARCVSDLKVPINIRNAALSLIEEP
jgi:hypothetical protein